MAWGLLRRHIEKTTGLSRAQVTRLIARYTASGRVQVRVYQQRRFAELYTQADIKRLASIDEAHETLSGPATHPSGQRSSAGDPGCRLCATHLGGLSGAAAGEHDAPVSL